MPRIVVVGGGWAGCAAALAAAKAGAEVILLERTDMLLGTGLVGGIFRNNGRFTAAEEAIAMGGGELFQLMDSVARHKNIEFPGHKHASLYDVRKIEPEVEKVLKKMGVKILLQSRCVDVKMKNGKMVSVILEDKTEISGDCFIDCTGTAAVPGNCIKYGNGCAMCILRCHTFKPRISITEKAGVKEYVGKKADGTPGVLSGSCKLVKESLAPNIQKELNEKGVVVIPLPEELIKPEKLGKKACVQYALREYAENIVLLDTGPAKLMTSFFPLEELRSIPGFEYARYEDPLAGGIGNSVRFMAMAPRDNTLKVQGIDNLFCAGEKAGPQVGHTEAIVTGLLAGHNAVKAALGMDLLEIPSTTAIGDFISFVNKAIQTEEGLRNRYTFSGGLYFERMKKLGLYTTNIEEIKERVEKSGLTNVFSKKLIK
jgi:hypothetical protein